MICPYIPHGKYQILYHAICQQPWHKLLVPFLLVHYQPIFLLYTTNSFSFSSAPPWSLFHWYTTGPFSNLFSSDTLLVPFPLIHYWLCSSDTLLAVFSDTLLAPLLWCTTGCVPLIHYWLCFSDTLVDLFLWYTTASVPLIHYWLCSSKTLLVLFLWYTTNYVLLIY